MKVRIEVEISDSNIMDPHSELVAQLYEQCYEWINNDTPPMLQFIVDDCEITEEYNTTWYSWTNQFDDTIN
tara:strand:- start:249 stop:461 length:213 start_codon:yes stop_codon:yes gene_type:complete